MLNARRKVQAQPPIDRRLFHRAYQSVTYQASVVKLAQQLGVQIKFSRQAQHAQGIIGSQQLEQDTSDHLPPQSQSHVDVKDEGLDRDLEARMTKILLENNITVAQ